MASLMTRGRHALLVLALVGCDKPAPPTPRAEPESNAMAAGISRDPLEAEIRRIKDLLMEDRLDEARRAMRDLERGRDDIPVHRRIEIERLRALFAAAR